MREAAASDTAAVIIDGSCAAEGIIDGRNGFLIEENAASLAAKLKELAADPTIMKKVGITAGEEIYISWDDAVANAVNRYEIVIEKYKRGDYGVHDIIRGSWMQSQGELMQILGDMSAAGRYLREGIKDEISWSDGSDQLWAIYGTDLWGKESGVNEMIVSRSIER